MAAHTVKHYRRMRCQVGGHDNSVAYHDTAVLGAAGDDVVVVRTELDVQDRPCVAAHGGVGHVDAPRLQRDKGGGYTSQKPKKQGSRRNDRRLEEVGTALPPVSL